MIKCPQKGVYDMAHQYVNAYSMSVRTDTGGTKSEVFLTFYQDHPAAQQDGTIKNVREPVSTLLLGSNLAKNLSNALADVLKEQET